MHRRNFISSVIAAFTSLFVKRVVYPTGVVLPTVVTTRMECQQLGDWRNYTATYSSANSRRMVRKIRVEKGRTRFVVRPKSIPESINLLADVEKHLKVLGGNA